MKRIMIAGTHSGCGKSVVACALIQALVNRGIEVTAFKNGPSYLDTVFYKSVLGIPAYNLDTYLMTKNTVNYLLNKNGGDFALLAGSLGYYDGYCFTMTASSCELSLWTDTPVILVVDGEGMGAGVGAVIKGFLEYGRNNIIGVIFTNIRTGLYPFMKQECEKLGIKAFGYFDSSSFKVSSHLGIATKLEIDDFKKRTKKLAVLAEETIDIDEIINAASKVSEISYDFNPPSYISDVRIAYAYDKAFCFYYEENLQLLEELGAELIPFSPLTDKALPENADGLIIGDGYISIYAKPLSDNTDMLKSVHKAVTNGMPCIAESGGFMYLHNTMTDFTGSAYKMAGVIDGQCSTEDTQQGYFYITMKSLRDNLLCDAGEKIAAYEVHSYSSSSPGTGFAVERDGWSMKRVNSTPTLYAGFPHIHFYSNIDFARNFIKRCAKRRQEKERK